jgi:hypothetical protein
VAWIFQVFFHVHHVIVESRFRFSFGHGDGLRQFSIAAHNAHTATAAAAGRFDDNRVANAFGMLASISSVSGPSEPGTVGTPAFFIAVIADTLSPIRRMVSAFGPMKIKPERSTCSAKLAFSERKP